MPAPPYEGWHHLRIEGDRDAANALRPLGRKVLGEAVAQAKFNNLTTYKYTLQLPDGGSITGELRGGIPRTTIRVGGKGPGKKIRTLEGFYFPRYSDIDEIHHPAMLVEPTDEDDSDYKALFYSREEAGFELVPEDRRGTYLDVFGPKAKKNQRLDPAGGMWVDRETKEAVSWFRGYLGYWPLHYRHPITNYGPWVSIYGHRVYTVPYVEWRVLSAAKRGMSLYVLICENLGALNPPERPAQATESGQVWCSQPYTDEPYTYSLWRYPLSVVTQQDTLIDTYKAARHELAEMLWQGELSCAYGAWSFNADCTEVVTIQLPRIAAWAIHTVLDVPAQQWEYDRVTRPDYPISEAKRLAITIDYSGGTPTASYSEEPAPITVAEEDGVKLNLVLAERTPNPIYPDVTDYSRMEFQCGDFAVAAVDGIHYGARTQLSRTIVYANLPTKTFLFLRRALGGGIDETVDLRFELYIDGVEVPITDDPYAVSMTVDGVHPGLFDEAHSRLRLPYIGVANASNEWAFVQDIDAMTFLLGINFSRSAAGDAYEFVEAEPQRSFDPTIPYIPFTIRLDLAPNVLSGPIPEHAGAGGWSFSYHGGPGPFEWDDVNPLAAGARFNHGEYLDPEPSILPYFCPYGGVVQYENNVVIAVKIDPWGQMSEFEGASPYPFAPDDAHPDEPAFYPLRYGTNGDARDLIDAIDGNRLSYTAGMFLSAYSIGHTGTPMRRQKTRFDP